MREVLALVLVASLMTAGCTALDATAPTADAPADSERAPEPAPLALLRPEVAPRGTLPISIAHTQAWLKPFGAFEANATVPMGSDVAWFVDHESVEARATVVDGEAYLLKSTTPDPRASGPRSKANVPELAPDGRARLVRIDVAGRYLIDAGGATLEVVVWPRAPADAQSQSFLVEDRGRLRFEPDVLELRPGSRIALWSEAAATHAVRESAFAAYVPVEGAFARVTPIDEGMYRLHAIATDGRGARGIATAHVLVDFERPSETLFIGPRAGRFLVAEGGIEDPVRIGFTAMFPMDSLHVHMNATSPLALPPSLTVTLEREGEPIAQTSTLTSATLEVADLPEGKYTLVVSGEHGALVAFDLNGAGRYRLPTPERLLAVMAP